MPTSAHKFLRLSLLADAVAPLAALGEFEIYDLGGGLGARYTWSDQPPSIAEYLDVLIRSGTGAPATARKDHHRTGPKHGRHNSGDHLSSGDRQARADRPSLPSTAAWGTTSRWRFLISVSRPESRTGWTPRRARSSPSSVGTVRAATSWSTVCRLMHPESMIFWRCRQQGHIATQCPTTTTEIDASLLCSLRLGRQVLSYGGRRGMILPHVMSHERHSFCRMWRPSGVGSSEKVGGKSWHR